MRQSVVLRMEPGNAANSVFCRFQGPPERKESRANAPDHKIKHKARKEKESCQRHNQVMRIHKGPRTGILTPSECVFLFVWFGLVCFVLCCLFCFMFCFFARVDFFMFVSFCLCAYRYACLFLFVVFACSFLLFAINCCAC